VTRVPCFGGYSRILDKADEIRNEVPNSLFLNAGDEFQGGLQGAVELQINILTRARIIGTLFYSYYGGEVIAEMLNQGNFSAFTVGNHEFDGGELSLPVSCELTEVYR
jgi:2',3'-cyclic-nucleotide 2'-phosphodiesterase (5'-nucleotidase family)